MAIQEALSGRLGPYRLLDLIGEGGMGVVHLAADSRNRRVAVKTLRPHVADDGNARRRLAREVETMRRVRSPYVAEVVDADVTGDVPYLVTRFVPGSTLEQVVARDGPLRGAPLQRLAYGLASALAAMHATGVIHRDLKPGNVVMADGDPVVIDFGIALLAGATPFTQTGILIGTPGYLAPEVLEGQSSRPSSDVHSWGATVAFAARGEPPYGTGSYDAVFCRIVRGAVLLDGIHGALYPLVAAALLRQPTQRPSAAWLASQVARLDLTAHAPSPMSAALGAPPPDMDAAARVLPARMSGLPGKPAMRGCQPPSQQSPPFERPADVAHLLPPVQYAPPVKRRRRHRAGPSPAALKGDGVRDQLANPPARRRHLLAFMALVIAAGISFTLPITGTAAAVTLIVSLRTAERVQTGLAARRNAHGPRAADAVVVAVTAPWVLARSTLVTILLAPFLLIVAVLAAATAISAAGRSQMSMAAAWAAGGFTVLNCIGPGSRAPRRELHRLLNAIARTRLAAATAALLLGGLAATVVTLAFVRAPALWPIPNPHWPPVQLPSAHLIHNGILRLWHTG